MLVLCAEHVEDKISLAPGETKKVTFEISEDMLKFYDPARGGWVLENGTFTFHVGAASDDIRTTCTAKL